MTFSLALASVSATPTHLKLPSASRRKISKAGSNALSFLPWGQEGVQLGLGESNADGALSATSARPHRLHL